MAIIPIARAELDITAIAASPFILTLPLILKSITAAIITTGTETSRGAILKATAMQRAPKATWPSPSPIIEYRLSTRLTPSSDAQTETIMPTATALTMKS